MANEPKLIPCPINGCGRRRKESLLVCRECWRLIPLALRLTFQREKRIDPESDSVTMAAVACLAAAEAELSQGGGQ